MWTLIDPVESCHFHKLFTMLFARVQRSNWLKQFQYLDEGYLAPIDGTGHFASGTIHCKECCCKNLRSKNPQHYHQLLALCLVKPSTREVFKLVRSYGHRFIIVAKDGDHQLLMQAVDEHDAEGQVKRHEYTDEKGYRHWFRYVNAVPINTSHPDVLINYLEYVELSPKGKKFSCTWITNLELTSDTVTKVMRAGRARWKIENETFNTLKTQGYNLEHNYGHGEQHLATNLAMLMFLAFLIDQIEQLACPHFRAAWHYQQSKVSLWFTIRSLFEWFLIDCWNSLLVVITQGHGQGKSIRSLMPDTA